MDCQEFVEDLSGRQNLLFLHRSNMGAAELKSVPFLRAPDQYLQARRRGRALPGVLSKRAQAAALTRTPMYPAAAFRPSHRRAPLGTESSRRPSRDRRAARGLWWPATTTP